MRSNQADMQRIGCVPITSIFVSISFGKCVSSRLLDKIHISVRAHSNSDSSLCVFSSSHSSLLCFERQFAQQISHKIDQIIVFIVIFSCQIEFRENNGKNELPHLLKYLLRLNCPSVLIMYHIQQTNEMIIY